MYDLQNSTFVLELGLTFFLCYSKKYHQYSNISYGYASNDIESDKVVVENTFNKSQEFFIYFDILIVRIFECYKFQQK